ncbi:20969_t:CDS:1, partial [Racocetra persica]
SSRSSSFRERRSEERIGKHNNSMRKFETGSFPKSKSENSVSITTRAAAASDTGTSLPTARKKLELKPRSTAAPSNEAPTPRSTKPNPF